MIPRNNLSSPPSMDAMLKALAHQHRRRLLVELIAQNPQNDDDTQVPVDVSRDSDDVESLLITMYHTHLPKLGQAGLIEWDQESNTVRKGSQFEEIRPLLEIMENHADELPADWL